MYENFTGGISYCGQPLIPFDPVAIAVIRIGNRLHRRLIAISAITFYLCSTTFWVEGKILGVVIYIAISAFQVPFAVVTIPQSGMAQVVWVVRHLGFEASS